MNEDPFNEEPSIPRDRFGRPMVIPVGGSRSSKLKAYTRCTTYVGALEDTYNIEKWKMRMTALGLAMRPDLLLAVVAHQSDKARMNELVDQAVEAAKASAGATAGTAWHALTEQLDLGELKIAEQPELYRPTLLAYQAAVADFEMLDIEQFMVNDDLMIGGTPDRRVRHRRTGKRYIFDLKTGQSIDLGMGKIAMQLAVYAHCQAYDMTTGERTEVEVDQERAIVAHMPAGSTTCDLFWVDIDAGWRAVAIAGQVRSWRKRKDLHAPLGSEDPLDPDPILTAIRAATEVTELRHLWASNHATRWTQVHTDAAAIRKAEIRDAIGVSA